MSKTRAAFYYMFLAFALAAAVVAPYYVAANVLNWLLGDSKVAAVLGLTALLIPLAIAVWWARRAST